MEAQANGQPEPPGAAFNHLRTATSSSRLNQIEQIRSYGVGDFVALPQLVVCGDQSAGKSSVLEGITGIPFPRQEGLCTRFPTEIILRHTKSSEMAITASIRPHISRPNETQKMLASYSQTIKEMSELPFIIEEVSTLMKIRGYSDDAEGFAFAPDALRIEVSGPIGLHLSVVDLPGLISVSSEEQTEEDVEAVHDMVTTYLQSSRTIILTVLQAGNDIANQPIIKLARKHDPRGQRTVGIITKPDLINEGTEAKIALIAKNQDSIKLKLGFFLVKNPSPSEIKEGLSMEARSKRELRFFSTGAWASQNLNMDRVGSENLRSFLQRLLDSHIERELPKVRDEIKKCLATTVAELASFGTARPTVNQIRPFLTSLSMKLYELFRAALDGNYHSVDPDFFSENEVSRLRAKIQQVNTQFAADMRNHGKRRMIKKSTSESQEGDNSAENAEEEQNGTLLVSQEAMISWVKKVYFRTRGKELPGNSNSALLAELFNEQSQRWRSIAEEHVQQVLSLSTQWIQCAIKRLIHEELLRDQVGIILEQWLENTANTALKELEHLMEDEKRGPQTYNHYYTDNVQKARKDSEMAPMEAAVKRTSEEISNQRNRDHSYFSERLLSSLNSQIAVDMDEQACNEALTQLNAYYKVAMKTFVDNVARQVIERHIVAPLPNAFCPNSVSQLSDEELLQIGSEPADQVERRKKLTSMVEGLKKSLRDLQKPL
ncbi:hypothetical protein CDD81_5351 [Ophiocordyceps australis]|uniref:GED domain-containing protein n=1 Tax=Ophiocordyceps australis TaxID=1399860 RepID=A0A2C5Y8F6_9HYPO|nr:hypothetical protein CDD81_5351 [Ophiocordyceps australis]